MRVFSRPKLTLLHIGIERGMIKSKLVFEPWTLDPAKGKLANIGMVLSVMPGTTTY